MSRSPTRPRRVAGGWPARVGLRRAPWRARRTKRPLSPAVSRGGRGLYSAVAAPGFEPGKAEPADLQAPDAGTGNWPSPVPLPFFIGHLRRWVHAWSTRLDGGLAWTTPGYNARLSSLAPWEARSMPQLLPCRLSDRRPPSPRSWNSCQPTGGWRRGAAVWCSSFTRSRAAVSSLAGLLPVGTDWSGKFRRTQGIGPLVGCMVADAGRGGTGLDAHRRGAERLPIRTAAEAARLSLTWGSHQGAQSGPPTSPERPSLRGKRSWAATPPESRP